MEYRVNMAYNKNEVTNLNTFYNAGEINGQGLSGAYSQRIADGQPLYAFYVREFLGFDEDGLAQYSDNEVQKFVDKSPLPTWTLGLTNNLKYKNFDLSIFFTGQLGQYCGANTILTSKQDNYCKQQINKQKCPKQK